MEFGPSDETNLIYKTLLILSLSKDDRTDIRPSALSAP
jgi:hypothetical protein